jgi:heme-binding protein
MHRAKKILIALAVIFIATQFIKPAKNRSAQLLPTDITKVYRAPDTVQSILKTSCDDCHSNNTNYPWYFNIQPAAWIMAHHIKEGKADLNFSDFGYYSQHHQRSKLEAIADQIDDGDMPLTSYTFIHKNAILSKEQKTVIGNWVTSMKDSLEQNR